MILTGLQQSSDDTLKNRFKRTVLQKLWGDDYKKVCYLFVQFILLIKVGWNLFKSYILILLMQLFV
jgi:hypothetical protein